MLTNEQWLVFEPLVEACRPAAKVASPSLRQTMSAILWRHETGAKWRSVPQELGPWWKAAQTFIRWSKLGVWDRLLRLAQARGLQAGMPFIAIADRRTHPAARAMAGKMTLHHNEVTVRRLACLVATFA